MLQIKKEINWNFFLIIKKIGFWNVCNVCIWQWKYCEINLKFVGVQKEEMWNRE